ncbi:hypothetical protein Fcan01_25042 [Folsomia candida]|uniref:ER-bound oxygenase mpaB/mpaB'/Rubber oxygenase catalytic domain-containing protein n=1 Tax=Folsomia candida TaxID=158441 RepID=A0A226D5P5_FOLCA|nr:hypothetical protein Fcan01_25042 [Folsomia candida]
MCIDDCNKMGLICAPVFLLIALACALSSAIPDNCQSLVSQFTCTTNPDLITSKLPACCVAYEDYISGRYVDGNTPRVDISFPTWINYDLMARGQRFARENWFSIGLAVAIGRAAIINDPDVIDAAMFTGHISFTPRGSALNMAGFAAKAMVWYQDVQTSKPLSAEGNDFLQSVNRIRWIHIMVARDIEAKRRRTKVADVVEPSSYANITLNERAWQAFGKDLNSSNIPPEQRSPYVLGNEPNMSIPYFNQHSLSYFMLNAFAYPILMGDVFGIDACDEDLWAFNHLAGVIGYTFGLDDKFNAALQEDLFSAKEFFRNVWKGYVVPGFFNISLRAKITIENFMAGTRLHQPSWTLELYLYRILTMLINVPAPNMYNLLTKQDRMNEDNLKRDLITVGRTYYGENYTTNWARARNTFYTPIKNM